jgi:hypothetical protein
VLNRCLVDQRASRVALFRQITLINRMIIDLYQGKPNICAICGHERVHDEGGNLEFWECLVHCWGSPAPEACSVLC